MSKNTMGTVRLHLRDLLEYNGKRIIPKVISNPLLKSCFERFKGCMNRPPPASLDNDDARTTVLLRTSAGVCLMFRQSPRQSM